MKFLVLLSSFFISSQAFGVICTLTQTESWFRNDNGTQTSATFIGSQNSNQTFSSVGSNIRLRMTTQCTGGLCANGQGTISQFNWKYSYKSGAYTAIGTTCSGVPVCAHSSSNVTGGTATTSQLTGGTGTFAAGDISTTGPTSAVTWDGAVSSSYTENELVFQFVSGQVHNADTLAWEVVDDGTSGCVIGTYTQIPVATISITNNHGLWWMIGENSMELITNLNKVSINWNNI